MQEMRCSERIQDEVREERRPDLVRWAVQVSLLILVSPALLAVLLIGGTCVSVQKIAAMTDGAFSASRPGLKLAASRPKPVRKPATPARFASRDLSPSEHGVL